MSTTTRRLRAFPVGGTGWEVYDETERRFFVTRVVQAGCNNASCECGGWRQERAGGNLCDHILAIEAAVTRGATR